MIFFLNNSILGPAINPFHNHNSIILQLTEDQIFALAPDEASKKAGQGLATPSKWVTRGINEKALWGECQGSGSKPYQTQVDLTAMAFKCSCPSRKFPCKHGLGLLLLCARNPGLFAQAEMPQWVGEWINKRSEKEEKKTEKADKPVDEAAQAKRLKAREQKVSDGISELLIWIKDIVRNGILTVPEKNTAYWDNMSRRMVDAQATGLAAMIKELSTTNFWNEGWQRSFMDSLLRLYMVAESYQHSPAINPPLQQDIRSAIGFTVNQDELKQQTGVSDIWLVIGKENSEEQQLTIEKNWLYGLQTNQYALILQYIAGGQTTQLSLTTGMFLQAELVFFPSAIPYRAIVKNHTTVTSVPVIPHYHSWKEVAAQETLLNSRLPFRQEMPSIVAALTPVQYQKQWWLLDADGFMCQIPANFKEIWPLMAISGGQPLTMSVMGKENQYRPLGVWHQNTYKAV